tara:strand:+ start:11931 stop:12767 length:837 start_codon:yes stop_codon:yes gene_type:complete
MLNVIGFGTAGCRIAEKFEEFPQYKVHYIDVGRTGKGCHNFPKCTSMQQAEEKTPKFGKLKKEQIGKDIIFICAGSGVTSGGILQTLERLKSFNVRVVYVRPNSKFVANEAKLRERAVRGVLQAYARAGLLDRLYLVSNEMVAKSIGQLSLYEYFDRVNEFIRDHVNMLEHIKNLNKFIINNGSEPGEINKISTIGFFNMNTKEENLFYDMEDIREKSFFYLIKEETLKQKNNFLDKIIQLSEEATEGDAMTVSYSVTPSTYEDDYVFLEVHTNRVQD